MILYIMVALWPLLIMSLYLKNTKSRYDYPPTKYLVLAALPMFTMLALRGEMMGADTIVYSRHFVQSIDVSLSQMIDTSRMEIGYLTFVKGLTYVTHSPILYQVICATIYMIGFVSFSKQLRGTDSFLFFYFVSTLGLFMFLFTGVRQCLAISICLYSYQFMLKRKYWIVLLLIALAYTFHKSSLLFAVTLFVWNRNLKWYGYLLYIVVVYIAYKYLMDVQMWINDKFDYDYEVENVGGGLIFLMLLSILTFYSAVIKKRSLNDLIYSALFNINVLTLVFWILRLQTRVAERPSYYFLPFSCALFACVLGRTSKEGTEGVYRYMIIAFTLLLYVYRLFTNFSSLVPYSTFI